jgi:hypothetical protein
MFLNIFSHENSTKMKQASYIDVLSQELMSCLEKDVILVYLEQYVFLHT